MANETAARIDTLLQPLLLAVSEEQADDVLLQLINAHAEPVIRGIIRYKLHLNSHQASEADDIYQEVLVQLLAELQQLRDQPDAHPITDLRGMAAVIAHRTCSRWMRRQFPERHAFKSRLQYLLTRQRGMALWQDNERKLVAGFAAWQGQKNTANPERLGRLLTDEVKKAAAGAAVITSKNLILKRRSNVESNCNFCLWRAVLLNLFRNISLCRWFYWQLRSPKID